MLYFKGHCGGEDLKKKQNKINEHSIFISTDLCVLKVFNFAKHLEHFHSFFIIANSKQKLNQ
jgi:hypothetical protein